MQYRDCQLTYTFPDGIKFGVIAKQFGAHSCVTPMHRPAWHNDRRFVILRYDGKVPALASCARCERKFFTPSALIRDASGAEEYWEASSMCMSVTPIRSENTVPC